MIGSACGKVAFYTLIGMRLIWFNNNDDDESGPINSLFLQEPENDPRRSVWVWQCAQKGEYAQFELYSLEFVRRDILKAQKGRETFYQQLKRVVSRFSYARKCELIHAMPLEQYSPYQPTDWTDWCGACPALSLAVFGVVDEKFRLVMFDLNRYFASRCPGNLGKQWDKNYFTIGTISDDVPIDFKIDSNSFKQFKSGDAGGALLETDKPYLEPVEPSSLTFELQCLNLDEEFTFSVFTILGAQESALASIVGNDGGLDSMIAPDLPCKRLEMAGLTLNQLKDKKERQNLPSVMSQTIEQKREIVFDAALRYGQLPWLRQVFTAARDSALLPQGIAPELMECWLIRRCHHLKAKINGLLEKVFLSTDKEVTQLKRKLVAIQTQMGHLTRMLDLMAKTADPRNVTLQASKATKANLSYVQVIHWLLEIGVLPEHPDHSLNLESRHMISIIAESWIDYPPKSIKSIVDGLLTQKTSKQLVLSVLLYLVLELGVDLDEKRIDWFFKSQGLSSSIRDYMRGCFALDHGATKECVKYLMPRQCARPSLRHWLELLNQFNVHNDNYSAMCIMERLSPRPESKVKGFILFSLCFIFIISSDLV